MTERSSCDVCGATDRPTATMWAYGIETNACDRCRGVAEIDWPRDLARRETDAAGVCRWCDAGPDEPCASDALVPGCRTKEWSDALDRQIEAITRREE